MKSRRSKKGENYYVFETNDEFKNFFGGNPPPLITDWRNAQSGDWIKADDGGITLVVKRGLLKFSMWGGIRRENVGYLRTVVGSFLCLPETVMDTDFEKHKQWQMFFPRTKPKKQIKKKDELILIQIVNGVDPHEAYHKIYPNRKSKIAEEIKIDTILKHGKVLEKAMEKAVEDAAKKLGINAEFVLTNMKDLAENAEKENVKLGANIELGKVVELYPKDKKPQELPWHYTDRISASEVEEAEVLPEHPKELTK